MAEHLPIYTSVKRPKRLPDEVARQLSQAIDTGRLPAGERLPTEQQLASEFGVSRSVVREAVSRLKSEGLIDVKHGIGAFVVGPANRSVFRIPSACFEKRKELVMILQLRTSVEADAAALAAEQHRSEHLDRLRHQIRQMRQAVAVGKAAAVQRLDAEDEFYLTVSEASGNTYFLDFTRTITGKIKTSLRNVAVKNAAVAEWGEAVLAEHEAVLDAITRRDREQARASARRHFENAAARLTARADVDDG